MGKNKFQKTDKKGKISLMDLCDVTAFVKGEMIKESGEDSYIISSNEEAVLLGVFDGCGGSGAQKYQIYGNHTGAYLGSRVVCGAVTDWFNEKTDFENDDSWGEQLKENIQKCLDVYKMNGDVDRRFKGSIVKDFPTTAAFCICKQEKMRQKIHYYWAGDSRGYLLTTKGMYQITIDDINHPDAMRNITNDGVLKNVISASQDFQLHEYTLTIDKPFIVLNATDGCFNYLPSPMHFEFLFLSTLLAAQNVVEWSESLANEIMNVTGDDYTLTMASFGYGSFDNLQREYKNRLQYLYDVYINRWDEFSQEEHIEFWHQYQAELGGLPV